MAFNLIVLANSEYFPSNRICFNPDLNEYVDIERLKIISSFNFIFKQFTHFNKEIIKKMNMIIGEVLISAIYVPPPLNHKNDVIFISVK